MIHNNTLAFIALAHEYCQALQSAAEAESATAFIDSMLHLLPRLYMAATDLEAPPAMSPDEEDADDDYIAPALDEDYYDSVRRAVEAIMGPDDTFLEVFEEDMKYSDTPIAASVSELLADLFQVFYNFTEQVRNQPAEMLPASIRAIRQEFESYWSRLLCNVMRPLNAIRYSPDAV